MRRTRAPRTNTPARLSVKTPSSTSPPFHTFDFSLVTDACTNSDSHSRTSLSARNAYEGTIKYKNRNYKEKTLQKNNHDWQFSCVIIKIAPTFDLHSFLNSFLCYKAIWRTICLTMLSEINRCVPVQCKPIWRFFVVLYIH